MLTTEPVKIKVKRDRLGGVSKPVEPPVEVPEDDEEGPVDEGDEELEFEEVTTGEAGNVDVSDGDEGDDKNAWLKFSSKDTNLAAESDSSDDEGPKNRIGNVPLNWYDEYDHIGYDVSGKRIARKPRQDNIDALLAGKDKNKVTIYDPLNDERVILSEEELNVINRIRKGKFPHKEFDPYAEYEFPRNDKPEIHPLGNPIEPKSRFIPSKWEAKAVIKLVHSIRNGWLKLDEKKEDPEAPFLLWADDEQVDTSNKLGFALPAPKVALPGHAESYNPPPEYLPSEEELQQWHDMDPEDRPFLPRAYSSMREIPAFAGFVRERFDRCLDLYMCPRARINRVKMDPQALIPKLPKPEELRPFPSILTLEYKGHTGNVRSLSLDPRGQWLVSGGDDGTVRLWEVSSARCFREWKFDEVIECVAWNPNPVFPLIAVVLGTKILILDSHTGGEEEAEAINTLLAEGRTAALTQNQSEQVGDDDTKKRRRRINVDWHLVTKAGAVAQITQVLATAAKEGEQPSAEQALSEDAKNEPVFPFADPLMSITTKDVTSKISYRALINVKMRINRVVWHHKGDYFASVSPKSSSFTSVLIHRISQSKSQTPFTKNKGLIQSISFHPSKPFFFVASQRNVRIYNLQTQVLVKKLLTPAKWISSMAIHPSGDHVLLGSYDRRVCWYDLDLSSTPFKTLKYHTKAVRQVQFHQTYPLFATCSDDGNVHIFHCKVFSDLLTNPLLVPVKLLKVQTPTENLGVLDCKFHPSQPWLFTSGSDNIVRLFT